MEIEKQYQFSHKGKKFKTKYFAALKELYKEEAMDGHCKTEDVCVFEGRPGTDNFCDMVGKK